MAVLDSLDDPLMAAREVQPMPQSTPTAGLPSELAGQILGPVVSQAVYLAARFGIADLLADGPRSATELAVAAESDPDGLYRLLRPLAEVLTAQPWRGTEPVLGVSATAPAHWSRDCWSAGRDCAGSSSTSRTGVAEAADQVAAAGLADRCQTVAGSFFQGVPEGGDVYVLAYVLHSWQDDQAREILGAIRRVIPDHGRLLIAEEIVAPPNQPGGKLMDLLVAAVGGRERTEQEWRAACCRVGHLLLLRCGS